MLYKFDVRTGQGSLLTLPLGDTSGGYEIRDIGGLDPVKATISSSTFAGVDGTQYHSAQLVDRNITIEVGFKPDYVTNTVGSLRRNIASLFDPKSLVDLRFYDDEGLTVDISGRVESCEAPLFTDDPKADISIICNSPDFIALEPIVIPGMSTSGETPTTITYNGTSNTGFEITLGINRDLTELTIYNRAPDGNLYQMDIAGSFMNGDALVITTVTGLKRAMLVRGGTNTSVMYAISPQSSWFQLQEGDNNIRVYAEGDPMPYSFSYTERYGSL